MNRLFDKKVIKAAFPKTIPVLTGYMVLGFGFGLLLQSKGYNFIWAFFMSVTIFAGSMQYVAIDLMSTGVSLVSAGIMTFLINARHLFYGISMLIKYKDVKKVKPYLIFGLTDETYSLLCTGEVPEGLDRDAYYFWITFLNQCYWITGSTLGAIFGQAVPINTRGVDFSMTALFIVIVVDNLLKKESRIPAIMGMAISFICLMIFGADNFLIPSMLLIVLALMLCRPFLSKRLEEGEGWKHETAQADKSEISSEMKKESNAKGKMKNGILPDAKGKMKNGILPDAKADQMESGTAEYDKNREGA